MPPRTLLAVPNVSEGSDPETIAAVGRAIEAPSPAGDQQPAGSVRLLDVHFDADHDRSVFTFAGAPRAVSAAMLRLAATAVERIDLARAGRAGQHPHVGALDVAPIVYLTEQDRGAACAEALVIADLLADELDVPVFLYGELTAGPDRPARTRAELRRGGVGALAQRVAAPAGEPGALRPDYGPARVSAQTGAVLVAARPPLVAFNVELAAPATVEDARHVAALVREGGEHGLPGVRAIGIELEGGRAQVSMNVERPLELPLAEVVRALAVHAPLARAELVGLAPRATFEGFPEDLPVPGFDPGRQLIENALGW